MKQTQEYILSEIKKTLQIVAPSAKAMLFGSRARNDADVYKRQLLGFWIEFVF